MESTPIVLAKLYLPVVFSLFSLVALFLTVKGEKRTLVKLRPLGGFVELEIPITNMFLVRSSLLLAVPMFLSLYLFYDYARLYPQHFRMEVFFDEAGIESSLEEFSPYQIASLSIPKEFGRYRLEYFEGLDTELRRLFGVSEFFSVKEGHVHSTGQAYTIVEKMTGWQKYHVTESQGEVTHILEIPDRLPRQFYTRFEKLASKDDYLEFTLADLISRRSMMLRTQYKQILVENRLAEGVLFKRTLVGITKLTVFPWPHVSNTVYLARFEGTGLVPIGYAIYR